MRTGHLATARALPRAGARAALLALGVTALGAACGGADGLGPRALAGVYVLQRVNDQALPATLSDGTRSGGTVYADTLTLRADGTLAEVWALGHTQGPSTTAPRAAGTWRVGGSAVTLTYQAAPDGVTPGARPTYTGAVDAAGALTFPEAGAGTGAVYARP